MVTNECENCKHYNDYWDDDDNRWITCDARQDDFPTMTGCNSFEFDTDLLRRRILNEVKKQNLKIDQEGFLKFTNIVIKSLKYYNIDPPDDIVNINLLERFKNNDVSEKEFEKELLLQKSKKRLEGITINLPCPTDCDECYLEEVCPIQKCINNVNKNGR